MTAPSDPVSYVKWRQPSRMAWPVANKDVLFKPGVNRVSTKLWDAIRTGVGKGYVKSKHLLEVPPPVDDVEAKEVHDADVKRGIIRGRHHARHGAQAGDPNARIAALEAKLAAFMEGGSDAVAEAMAEAEKIKADARAEAARVTSGGPAVEPPFDPSDAQVGDLEGLMEGLSSAELLALMKAEATGKQRSTALKAIGDALTAAG